MAREKKAENLTVVDMLDSFSKEFNDSLSSIEHYRPHDKQKIFHISQMKEKLFIGGNRSGKTVANVCECIWRATKTHPYRPDLNAIAEPVRGRFVTVSFVDGLIKIVLPLFKKWLPKKYLIQGSWEKSYNKMERTLTLNNGSFIEFMSYDQEVEKFAGTSRHFVAFDEEPPMVVWEECLLRLADTYGDWWISMTPVEGLTWIYEEIYVLWKDGERPRTLVLEVNIKENPHVSAEAREVILGNIRDKEKRAAREEGRFEEYGGRVYKAFSEETHVLRGEYRIHPDARIYTSLDTGFRHPAVWLWHAVEPSGRIVTFHEISLSETTVETLAQMVKEFEEKRLASVGQTVYLRTGDPAMKQTRETTGTSVIQEYAKHGLYLFVESVTRDLDTGINKVTQYLSTNLSKEKGKFIPIYQIHESCEELIRGMKRYRWDKYASKKMEYDNAPKKTPKKKDDDEVDSLRYFMTLMDDLTPDKVEIVRAKYDLKDLGIDYEPIPVPYDPEVPSDLIGNVYESSIVVGMES